MVVDYRALNRVIERSFFIIPNSDGIRSTAAGIACISVGDLKEGFNQVVNEEETAQKMAVLAASGCYLLGGLTFGPTNGPEDFQELVFIVFGRRGNGFCFWTICQLLLGGRCAWMKNLPWLKMWLKG